MNHEHIHGPDCQHDHDQHAHTHADDGHVHGPHCNHGPQTPIRRELPKLGRNEPCFCGSGSKYKKCHGQHG